jgi:hypothetical protein
MLHTTSGVKCVVRGRNHEIEGVRCAGKNDKMLLLCSIWQAPRGGMLPHSQRRPPTRTSKHAQHIDYINALETMSRGMRPSYEFLVTLQTGKNQFVSRQERRTSTPHLSHGMPLTNVFLRD